MFYLAANRGFGVFDCQCSFIVFSGKTLFQRRGTGTDMVLDLVSEPVGLNGILTLVNTEITAVAVKVFFRSFHQLGNDGYIMHIRGCRFYFVDESRIPVNTDVSLIPKVPLIPLLHLMRFRIALFLLVLGGRRRRDQGRIDDRSLHQHNLGHASVCSDRADLAINVREKPDINSKALWKLYPGTEVRLIFDYHNSGDGWHRIRNGSVSGYIRDDYLDFSTDGVPLLIPQWGMLKQPSAIVSGSVVGTVNQADPLFILGTTGNKNTPLYYCEGGTWVDEHTYKKIIFYIQQAYVEASGKGSISTKAQTNKTDGTRIYRFNQDQQIIPDEDLPLVPEGTEIRILTSLDQDGNPTGWGQYLTEDTVWV